MNLIDHPESVIGRAKALLVLKGEQGLTALITPVVATVCEPPAQQAFCFYGPVRFTAKSERHLETVIYPLVQRILNALQVEVPGFALSITNPAIAALHGVGATITDYSADLAVFMAVLSAGLKISIPGSMVFTGHMAALDGAIGMVTALPAKIKAVVSDPESDILIYPDPDQDPTLSQLAPDTHQKIATALAQAKHRIIAHGVKNIDDLVRQVFSEAQVVQASLAHHYYDRHPLYASRGTPLASVLTFFTHNLTNRFWQTLSDHLIQGQSREATTLLGAFADFHRYHQRYPDNMGKELFQALATLPPETRRFKIKFPLLPLGVCIELGKYADASAYTDLFRLMKACTGEDLSFTPKKGDPSVKAQTSPGDRLLEILLTTIGSDHLTTQVTRAIDRARASYVMDSVIVADHEVFYETIATYYLHLLRHTRSLSNPVSMDGAEAEGLALVERTFSTKGGLAATLSEAKHGPKGGLRWILDRVTEQFKKEEVEKYVSYRFKTILDPLDWEGKVKLMEAFMARLGDQLPAEIATQPPERFATNYTEIVHAYCHSMEQVTTLLRSL